MASFANGLQKEAINSGISTGVDVAKSGGKAILNVAKDESQCLCLKMTDKTHEKWIRPKLYLNCGAGISGDVMRVTSSSV